MTFKNTQKNTTHTLTGKGNTMNTELERIQKESQQMEIEIAELRGARAVLKLDRESPHWDMEKFFEECRKERVA